MSLKHDVSCKFCHASFQIDDTEAHNLMMVGEKPICSDACFEKHYSDDCKCMHCQRHRGYPEPQAPAKFKEGQRVIVQSHPSMPKRPGTIKIGSVRWEYGNQAWGYAVNLDEPATSTAAIEDWLTKEEEPDERKSSMDQETQR